MVEPVNITLEAGGVTYSVKGLAWDIDGDSLVKQFKQLLVAAGFSPRMLNDEYGGWEWAEYDRDVK